MIDARPGERPASALASPRIGQGPLVVQDVMPATEVGFSATMAQTSLVSGVTYYIAHGMSEDLAAWLAANLSDPILESVTRRYQARNPDITRLGNNADNTQSRVAAPGSEEQHAMTPSGSDKPRDAAHILALHPDKLVRLSAEARARLQSFTPERCEFFLRDENFEKFLRLYGLAPAIQAEMTTRSVLDYVDDYTIPLYAG